MKEKKCTAIRKKILLLSLLLISVIFIGCYNENEDTSVKDYDVRASIAQDKGSVVVLDFDVNDYKLKEIIDDSEKYTDIVFDGGVRLNKMGFASLPFLHASVKLPGNGSPAYNVIHQDFIDISLENHFLPSKGTIYRNQDPGNIKRKIDPRSLDITKYPESLVRLSRPYIFRDVRGVNVYVYPFQYNAQNQTLRIYTKIKVSITMKDDNAAVNVLNVNKKILKPMNSIYESVFINFNLENKNREFDNNIAENGDILVIHTDRDKDAILPYVTWKRQNGYTVHLKEVTAGTNVSDTIQDAYNDNNDILYVQLVGDWAEIQSNRGAGANAPMDPVLGCVAGDDNYFDLIIGRFSAGSANDVTAQVNKTISYERNPDINGDWYSNALGIGSHEGPGDDDELDNEHIDVIHDNKLLEYTYDNALRLTTGGTDAEVADLINDGVGIINYTGHGLWDRFYTTNFDNNDVDDLTNGNMLPFIISVACINGQFHTHDSSFAETWLRKVDGGAIAAVMSTINQPWQPPMRGQDYMNDLLIGGYDYDNNPGDGENIDDLRTTFGSIVFNGLVLMYSESDTVSDLNTIQSWTIFGDASLQVRTDTPRPITLSNIDVRRNIPFTTRVTSNGSNVANARVTISNGDHFYTGVTNSYGNVIINHNLSIGRGKLVVTGYNYDTIFEEIQVLGGPDLIISSLVVTSWTTGSISYSYSIKNTGRGPADLNRVGIQAYISSDTIYGNWGDQYAGRRYVSPDGGTLEPGAALNGTFLIALSSLNPDARPYLVMKVDNQNELLEINENNNIRYARIKKPDLIVSSLEVTSWTFGSISFSYSIKNIGEGVADLPGVGIQAYISSDTIYGNWGDRSAGSRYVSSDGGTLEPGATLNGSFLVGLSYLNPIATPYLVVKVDNRNKLFESNENNNTQYDRINSP